MATARPMITLVVSTVLLDECWVGCDGGEVCVAPEGGDIVVVSGKLELNGSKDLVSTVAMIKRVTWFDDLSKETSGVGVTSRVGRVGVTSGVGVCTISDEIKTPLVIWTIVAFTIPRASEGLVRAKLEARHNERKTLKLVGLPLIFVPGEYYSYRLLDKQSPTYNRLPA